MNQIAGLPPEYERDHFLGDLFGESVFAANAPAEARRGLVATLFPGLAACGAAAGAAAFLADHYGFPLILLGLLIGASLNFIGTDAKVLPGLNFASGRLLQLAIVLLGFQTSVRDVISIGPATFGALLMVMAATVLVAVATSWRLRQPLELGLLAGCATAICGASAAIALYAVMDHKRIGGAHFAVTLAGISIASAVAMSAYPLLAQELALSDRQAGFLIGASIHDVAQAIGAGFAFSDVAGRDAMIIKLTRVALLAPVVMLASWAMRRRWNAEARPARAFPFPLFLAGFALVAIAASILPVAEGLRQAALTASKGLLVLAVTATAMRTRLDLLATVGLAGFAPVLSATVASFLTALAFCLW